MIINLDGTDLYEKTLLNAARAHKKAQSLHTKKAFDNEIVHFKNYVLALNPRLDRAYLSQKDLTLVIGNDKHVNSVVTLFNDGLFSNPKQLDKFVKKRFDYIEPLVTLEKPVNFNTLGVCVNFKSCNGKHDNTFVACAEFVSEVRIRSFCVIK